MKPKEMFDSRTVAYGLAISCPALPDGVIQYIHPCLTPAWAIQRIEPHLGVLSLNCELGVVPVFEGNLFELVQKGSQKVGPPKKAQIRDEDALDTA